MSGRQRGGGWLPMWGAAGWSVLRDSKYNAWRNRFNFPLCNPSKRGITLAELPSLRVCEYSLHIPHKMGNKQGRPMRPGEVPAAGQDQLPAESTADRAPSAGVADDSKTSEQQQTASGERIKRLSTLAQKATLDDFVLLKTVGKGSFGKVVQVRYFFHTSLPRNKLQNPEPTLLSTHLAPFCHCRFATRAMAKYTQ